VIRGRREGEESDGVVIGESFVAGWVAEGGAIDGAGPAQETSSAASQRDRGKISFVNESVIFGKQSKRGKRVGPGMAGP